jgi:membrane protease YdiL (CAAX protease family)
MATSGATSASRMPARLASAVEGFLAMMCCLFAASGAKSMVIDVVDASVLPDAAGLLQFLSAVLVLACIYGPRLRPRASSPPAAWGSVLAALARSFLPVFVWEAGMLFALHGIQVAAAAAWSSSSSSSSSSSFLSLEELFACGGRPSLLWAPLFEEAVFRAVLFYVVLQRSGGSVGLACLASACTFAAIHVANVWSTGGGPYSWLQVVAGAATGAAWSGIFACTGSLALVTALHAANNMAAVAWMSRGLADGVEGGCASTDASLPLIAGVGLLVGAATAATLASWRRLHFLTNDPVEVERGTFKKLHPVVYGAGGADGGEAEEEKEKEKEKEGEMERERVGAKKRQ